MALILKQEANANVTTPPAGSGSVFLNNSDQLTIKDSAGNIATIPQFTATGNTSVFFNDGGSFGQSANFTFTNTNNTLTVLGNVAATGVKTDNLYYANGSPWDLSDPGGSNTQIQFNDDESFGGSAALTFNKSTNLVSMGGALSVTGNANVGNIGAAAGVFTANVTAANIYANSGTVGASLLTGTLTTASQPNITTVGTLTNLNVSGNAVISGNLTVDGTLVYVNVDTLAVEDPVISLGGGPNGAPLASNDGKDRGTLLNYFTSAPVYAFMGWDNSNGEFGFGSNVGIVNDVVTFSTYGNLRAATVIANVSATTVAGSLTTAAQPNITSVGTLTSASVTGNVTAGNVYANSGTVGASLLTGTLTTNAQPNVTSLGTLGSLSVTNNVSAGGVKTDNLYYANGNPWDLQQPGGSNTQIQFNDADSFGGSAAFTFDKSSNVITASGNINANNFNATTTVTAGNVYANSGTIGATNLAGTLTTAAQPNITSVGTLGSLTVTNKVTAGQLQGDGGNISNIQGGNVSGTVATATTAGTVTTAAQPNITSVGTLTSLVVTGNATAGNVYANSGTIGANVITGNTIGGTLTTAAQPNITSVGTLTSLAVTGNVTAGNLVAPLANGNSNVNIPSANGNVNISAEGNANVLTVTGAGIFTTGTINAAGNINGHNLTTNGVLSVTGNANVGNIGAAAGVFTANITTSSGNIYANSGTIGASLLTGTLTTAAQPNITSVGTLTSLSVTGTATAGNLSTGGNLSVTGNAIVSGNLTVDGNLVYVNVETLAVEDPIIQLQSGPNGAAPASNSGKDVGTGLNYYDTQARVAFMGWDVSNAEFGMASQASITNEVVTFSTYGNLRVGNIIGNGQALTGLAGANVTGQVANAAVAGTVYTAAQPNITSVGTLSSLDVTANVTAGNVYANSGMIAAQALKGEGGNISNIQGANVSGTVSSATTAGTVTTAAQPNITSVGTLSALTVSGTSNVANLNASGAIVANGNVTGNYILGNGALLTGIDATSIQNGTANVRTFNNGNVTISAAGNANVLVVTGTGADVTGNITAGKVTASTLESNVATGTAPFVVASTTKVANLNADLLDGFSTATAATANTVVIRDADGSFSANVVTATLSGAATTAGTVTTAAQPNITSVGTLTSLGVTGNVTAGNVYANSGTIGAQTLKGEGGNISNIQGANVSGTVATATTAGTVTTAAQPNITSVGTLSSLTVTGNVSGGNLTTTGALSVTGNANVGNLGVTKVIATGNVEASYFIGNGSQLTGIDATAIQNGTANVRTFNNANVAISAAGNANIVVVTGTGANIAGTINATGNANVGNLGTAGLVTATGNVSGGNLTTAGVVAATGNVSGGNLTTAGVVTATGNVSGGNLTTTGVLTVSGTGVSSIAGNLDMTSNTIINLATPTNPTDAATKQYVDDIAQGLHTHDACQAATPDTLANITGGTITYNNGSSGVGANLVTTGSFNLIDGVNVQTAGTRILVKNEANSAHNGIYTWSNATVITRATDFDTPTEMAGGDFTFVQAGTLYDNTGWVMPDAVTTVGTSPVVWIQFSGAGTYTAGTGLGLNGSQFFIANTTVTAATYGNGDRVASFTVNAQGQITNAANTVITANAANLTGTTLASSIVTSSLTSVGTLGTLSVTGNANVGNIGAAAGVFTTVAGTLTTAAQPNITSVGTLSSLAVTANVTAGNVYANSGTVGAQTLKGEGGNISNIQGANVSGAVASATNATAVLTNTSTATTVYLAGTSTAANGHASLEKVTGIYANMGNNAITATTFVGALSGAATTAGTVTTAAQPNITSVGTLGSLSVTGNVTAANFVGSLANGNSDVNIPAANGNINFDVAGNANVVVMTGTGVNVAGTLNATGNANVGNIGATRGVFTNIAGEGGNISNIQGANVSGTVATATTAGTVTTAAQPNITSVGTLSSLTVSGNASAGNLNTAGKVVASTLESNVTTGTAPFVVASTTKVANLNADTLDGYDTATAATANTVAVRNADGNLTANFFIGNGSQLTGIAASVIANGNSNVSIPAANGNINFSVGGNANMLVVTSSNVQMGTGSGGNITGANLVSANFFTGTLTTAAQPNITSVGTLTSLAVTGNVTAGNIVAPVANGNSNLNIPSANGNVNISAVGNANVFVVTGTGVNVAGTLNATGNANVGNLGATGVTATTLGGTLTTAAQPNITSVGTLTSLSVTGNITGGNLIGPHANGNSNVNIPAAAGNVNISVNGTANVAVVTATGVNVAGTLNATGAGTIGGDLGVSGNAVITGNLAVNGNLTYLNVDTLSVEDPIIQLQTGANGAAPVANSGKDVGSALNYYDTQARIAFMGWDVSNAEFGMASVATIASDVVTFSTYGNLRVGNIIGNGQALTGLAGANVTGQVANALVAGTVYTAAQPNITSVGTLTSLTVTGNASAGNLNTAGKVVASTLESNVATGTAPLTVSSTTRVANLNVAYANVADFISVADVNTGTFYPVLANAATGNVSEGSNANLTFNAATGVLNSTAFTATGNISAANVVSSAYSIVSVGTGISAAGSTQGTGTVLTKEFNVVSTVASGAGVVLPTAVAGMRITVINTSANALLVYPASTGIINSAAANAAYSQPAGARLDYISTSSTQWYTLNATYG